VICLPQTVKKRLQKFSKTKLGLMMKKNWTTVTTKANKTAQNTKKLRQHLLQNQRYQMVCGVDSFPQEPMTVELSDPETDEDDIHIASTIGRIPLHWYDDHSHLGYNLDGKKVKKRTHIFQMLGFLCLGYDYCGLQKIINAALLINLSEGSKAET
jgi:hypothetical protein